MAKPIHTLPMTIRGTRHVDSVGPDDRQAVAFLAVCNKLLDLAITPEYITLTDVVTDQTAEWETKVYSFQVGYYKK